MRIYLKNVLIIVNEYILACIKNNTTLCSILHLGANGYLPPVWGKALGFRPGDDKCTFVNVGFYSFLWYYFINFHKNIFKGANPLDHSKNHWYTSSFIFLIMISWVRHWSIIDVWRTISAWEIKMENSYLLLVFCMLK